MTTFTWRPTAVSAASWAEKGRLASARSRGVSSCNLARTGLRFNPDQVASTLLPKHLGLGPQQPGLRLGPQLRSHLVIHAPGLLQGQQVNL